ncbi:MAG: hypothetical protein RL721_1554 [Candidatus Eisenbacteria bacterium]
MTDPFASRRERAAAAWAPNDAIVLVGAGSPVPIPGGADQTYPFLAHAEYLWLAGHETSIRMTAGPTSCHR